MYCRSFRIRNGGSTFLGRGCSSFGSSFRRHGKSEKIGSPGRWEGWLWMVEELWEALCQVNTSGQWSTLQGVTRKVSRKVGRPVDSRILDRCILSKSAEVLRHHGVWRCSFGENIAPILVINPSFRRSMQEKSGSLGTCTCQAAPANDTTTVQRYYHSADYNAGRHAPTNSKHSLSCPQWEPSKTSHLHSWRRGYED